MRIVLTSFNIGLEDRPHFKRLLIINLKYLSTQNFYLNQFIFNIKSILTSFRLKRRLKAIRRDLRFYSKNDIMFF